MRFRKAVSSSQEQFPSFDAFMQMYGRSYGQGSEEYETRRVHYERRVAAGQAQNSRLSKLWTARVSNLWDWSDEELRTLGGRRGVGGGVSSKRSGTVAFLANGRKPLVAPESWEWGNLTAMRNHRQQSGCGSCWAIATTTVLEAHSETRIGKHRTFSAQQLISCMSNDMECGGEGGCKGATVELAMDFAKKYGLPEEGEVPYMGRNGIELGRCPKTSTSTDEGIAFGLLGWEKLKENKEEPLVRALVELGPVAVSVAADQWHSYGNGIFDGCPRDAILNHAVVLIGFGKQTFGNMTFKYWQIQNSWGDDWGEEGNMRIIRHEKEEKWCGTDDQPELGSACKPYPDTVRVCGSCGILYDNVVPHFSI